MAQKIIQQERTVTDTIGAIECDLCTMVYVKGEPSFTEGMGNLPMLPEGSGTFIIAGRGKGNPLALTGLLKKFAEQKMDLCPACAGVTWDWLQERKRTE